MDIIFDEIGHTYTYQGRIIANVTNILGQVYGTGLENAPAHLVKARADIGSEIHKEAKGLQDGTLTEKDIKHLETKRFYKWFKDNNFKYTKSEFIAYASTPFGEVCGTVDLFADGYIYDLKTSKTATRKQLEKWQMQLSFYCYMLKQEGKSVLGLKVLHLTETGWHEIPLEYLGDDFVEATMKHYKEGTSALPEVANELQTVSSKEIAIFKDILCRIKTLESSIEPIKEAIKDEMEQRNILSLNIDNINISYIAPHKSKKFDSAKFKAEHEDLYKFYQKETDVVSSIRIKVC